MNRWNEWCLETYGIEDIENTNVLLNIHPDEIDQIKRDYEESHDGEILNNDYAADRLLDCLRDNFSDWLKEKYPNEYHNYFRE